MSYIEELSMPEWKIKRIEILERDRFSCVNCNIERPIFRGLVQSFGTKNKNEMIASGYFFFEVKDVIPSYNNILVSKDSFINQVYYVGNPNLELNFEKMKFSLQCIEQPVFGVIKRGYRIICFYDEMLNGEILIDLNVHHKYYIIGNKPWEYENDALISLCLNCHKLIHDNNEILIYSNDKTTTFIAEKCDRCGGSGYLDIFHYYHGGVCFKCMGEGTILTNF